MKETNIEVSAESAGFLDLGVVLGQSHAFSLIAGRCTAAQAAALQNLREEKLYKRCTPYWDEFCSKYLKISRSEADKIIRLWDEFGPAYFQVSELTRISAATYRTIAPSVKDGALQFHGEYLEFNAENSRKITVEVWRSSRHGPTMFSILYLQPNFRCWLVVA